MSISILFHYGMVTEKPVDSINKSITCVVMSISFLYMLLISFITYKWIKYELEGYATFVNVIFNI